MSECKDLKPTFCGKRGLDLPSGGCSTVRIEGADDVSINQGVCIDLTEGVHAYDGDGSEIEYTVTPSEIGCCDVGEHEVTYKAVGKGSELVPSFCMSSSMLHMPDCGIVTRTVKRIVTILQALPPKILGIERKILPSKGTFDALEDVYGIDDNGEETVVTFNGVYDDATSGDLITVDSVGGDSRSLKVTLEPIQDLNGYDSPWVGGAGKNKIDVADGTCTTTTTIVTKELTAGTYTFSAYGKRNDGGSWRVLVADANNVAIASGENTSGTTLTRCYATFTLSATTTVKLQFQFLSSYDTLQYERVQFEIGALTDYAPYENICPISGHTEVVTHRTGINVWDEVWEVGGIGNDGQNNTLTDRIRSPNYIPVVSGTTVYFKAGEASQTAWQLLVFCYDADKAYLGTSVYIRNATYTIPANCKYIRFHTTGAYGTTYNNDLSINYPSTDHDYHAYEGDTYTATLPETVYGGTLDVVSGELVVKWLTVLGTAWTQYNASNGYKAYRVNNVPQAKVGSIGKSNMISEYGTFNSSAMTKNIIQLPDSTGYTYMALDEDVSASDVQFIYELANPQTIQLTPQEVELLTGTNNVWAESDKASLHISDLGYPKQMPSGEFMFQYDGVYEVTYDTEDSCGNHTTETRLIYVGDDWSEDSFSPMACLGQACAMTLECSEDLPIVCHGTVCNAKLTCVEE